MGGIVRKSIGADIRKLARRRQNESRRLRNFSESCVLMLLNNLQQHEGLFLKILSVQTWNLVQKAEKEDWHNCCNWQSVYQKGKGAFS